MVYAYAMDPYTSPSEAPADAVAPEQQPVPSAPRRRFMLGVLLALIVLGALSSLYYVPSLKEMLFKPVSVPGPLPENPRTEHATYVNDHYGITLDYPKGYCLSVWIHESEATSPEDFPPGTISLPWGGNVDYTDEAGTRYLNRKDTPESACVRITGQLSLDIRDRSLTPEPLDARAGVRNTSSIFMTNEQVAHAASQLAAAPIGETADIPGLTDPMPDSEILLRSVVTTETGKAVVLATRDHFTNGSKEGEGIVYYFHAFSASGDLITGSYGPGVRDETARGYTEDTVRAREDWGSFVQTAASFAAHIPAAEPPGAARLP